jgi:hypothetical protein
MQPPARHKAISYATANAWIAKDTRKGVTFLRLRNVPAIAISVRVLSVNARERKCELFDVAKMSTRGSRSNYIFFYCSDGRAHFLT